MWKSTMEENNNNDNDNGNFINEILGYIQLEISLL